MNINRCPGCAANIHPSDTACGYCGASFRTNQPQQPIQQIQPVQQVQQNTAPIPRRPRIHGGFLILGLLLWFWPGFIYFVIVKGQQHEWDRKYGNNRR